MIVLPVGFVKTRYNGYFWHIPSQKLYSCKVDGVLKPMTLSKAFKNHPEGYRVSVNGFKRTLSKEYLMDLKYPKEGVELFPMKGE